MILESLIYNHLEIEVFTYADWARSPDDRINYWYCTIVGRNLVTWRSKKQSVVCEVLWLRKLLEELKLLEKDKFSLFCDNKATISITHNPV